MLAGYATMPFLLFPSATWSRIWYSMHRKHWLLGCAFYDLICALSIANILLIWIGLWDLSKEYVLPDLVVGGWVFHFIGTVGLFLCHTFKKQSDFGVTTDEAPSSEKRHIFDNIYYSKLKSYCHIEIQHCNVDSNIFMINIENIDPSMFIAL